MQALPHLQAPHPHPTPTPLPPPPHTLTAFDCSHPRQVLLGDGETHTRGWPSRTKLAAFLQPLGTRVVGLGRRFSRSSQTARELKVSSTGPAATQTHPATSRPGREAPHFSPPPHTHIHVCIVKRLAVQDRMDPEFWPGFHSRTSSLPVVKPWGLDISRGGALETGEEGMP